jgi:hypothetical protein
MADLMSKNFEVVTRPSEENYIMHVPEGGSSNVGNCGVQGVFDRLYDKQQMTVRINNTGPFIPFYEFNHMFGDTWMRPASYPTGVRYTIEPAYLTDVSGNEVVDVLNPLGGEEAYSIGRWKYLFNSTPDGGHYPIIKHPKIAPLKHAGDADPDYGHVAIAVWTERYDQNRVWFSLMSNRRRATDAPSTIWPYVWGEPFESASFAANTAISTSVSDIVEFDDGSLFLITSTVDPDGNMNIICYRSFDYAVTWTYCGEVTNVYDSGLGDHAVSIERINERLVVAYISVTSEVADASLYYSDDFGLTWTEGDHFVDGVTMYSKMCIDLVKGRDNILYLAINRGIAKNHPNIYIARTLDGINLSSEIETGLNFDLFSLVEDLSGTWMLIGRYRTGEEQVDFTAALGTDVFNAPGHSFVDGNMVQFDTLTVETAGVTTGATYFVRDRAADNFKVALTSGGAAIDITADITSNKMHEVYAQDGELAIAYNESDPYTDAWTVPPAGDPTIADYKFITQKTASGPRFQWDYVTAAAISNHLFIDMLALRYDNQLADTVAFKSNLSELKLGMWSGITADYPTTSLQRKIWDYTYFANCYPSADDMLEDLYPYTDNGWGFAQADVTDTRSLALDASGNRTFLMFSNQTAVGDLALYWMEDAAMTRAIGVEMRCGLRIRAGFGVIVINPVSDGHSVSASIHFDHDLNAIRFYDNEDDSYTTITPTNWTVGDMWNVYHIVYQGASVYLYRATNQYEEILNFELVGSRTNFSVVDNVADTSRIYWGASNVTDFHPVSAVDFEFFLLNISGFNWTLPIDQDSELLGRRAYYYSGGLYSGMSVKFDGTYGIKDDTWLVETGAIHEVENIFNPSPAICWKSSSYATDITDEPDEVFIWKQKDSSSGSMYQTVTGFAVFGRNWPYCKLEGSVDGVNYSTIFDSLATKTLSYIMRFAHTNAGSWYNQAIVTIPSGMPRLHVNRFASTPEISFYLMPTSGSGRFHIYKILENDESRFYLDRNMTHAMANTDAMIVFSDRFYFDLTLRARVARADGDIYGDTTFFPAQYRFFRLTVYGKEGAGAANQIIFPESDGGVKKTGSIHLGRVYELPDEEWGVSISLQPSMAVTESRGARKEYRRLGIARRNISLNYTGIIERGLGVNPIVDLNRSLGWGEYPLVFIDDIDVLQHGDVDSNPDTYGTLTHPNPILARMVDGYTMSRVAYSLESENQGDAAMNLTRSVVDVSGIRLEEVV